VKQGPAWVDKQALLYLHEESLAMFGGARGIRDEGLLDSAMARPINQLLHNKSCDLADLAAAYGFGIAKNYPFVDGNKRSAFMAIGLFLRLNAQRLRVDQVDAVTTIVSLAAGTLDEVELAAWIRSHMM
jgi:death on curing protein